METGGTVVTKSRKPLAKCQSQKQPGIPEPGPGPPPPTPRTSLPTHQEAAPQALEASSSGPGRARSSAGIQSPAPPRLVFGSHFNILRWKCQGVCVIRGEGQPFQELIKTRKQRAGASNTSLGSSGSTPSTSSPCWRPGHPAVAGGRGRPLFLSNAGCPTWWRNSGDLVPVSDRRPPSNPAESLIFRRA